MKPIYLIKYEQRIPYETITHYYECPFEEEVPIDKIQNLLEKEWNLPHLSFRSHVCNAYSFDYTNRYEPFFSEEVMEEDEIISVEVTVAIKIGTRYFECNELEISVKGE